VEVEESDSRGAALFIRHASIKGILTASPTAQTPAPCLYNLLQLIVGQSCKSSV
jgi:hypothetical protein